MPQTCVLLTRSKRGSTNSTKTQLAPPHLQGPASTLVALGMKGLLRVSVEVLYKVTSVEVSSKVTSVEILSKFLCLPSSFPEDGFPSEEESLPQWSDRQLTDGDSGDETFIRPDPGELVFPSDCPFSDNRVTVLLEVTFSLQ